MSVDHSHWASYLQSAADERREVHGIESQIGTLALDDAYRIQQTLIDDRVRAGDRVAGAKLGLTSKAKQEQMGVRQPAYGWLTASSLLPADADVVIEELIHPRVEPEFVFLIGRSLAGSSCTADDVLAATERVTGGIEVIDSRFEAFKFTLADVIADNTSAARAAIGDGGIDPGSVDLRNVTCTFTVDGEVTGEATGEALLGDPAECVAMLVRHLAEHDRQVEAGWVVLAGAPVDARPLRRGGVATADYSHFGRVVVRGI